MSVWGVSSRIFPEGEEDAPRQGRLVAWFPVDVSVHLSLLQRPPGFNLPTTELLKGTGRPGSLDSFLISPSPKGLAHICESGL